MSKPDPFNIINSVVFEVEKESLSQILDSVVLPQNSDSDAFTIPTAGVPEYQGFLRLLLPTPDLKSEEDGEEKNLSLFHMRHRL
ncbi:hypothetical protein TWF281_000586 [Arthrobotrys megalospora]